jgi:hypothetical protein
MSVDPLSPSTRTAKRNLLAAATIAITYSAFDVSISKIPLGGLAIEFDNRVFAFLLISVLLYFSATFALYYFIDVRNVERTKHQTDKETGYHLARNSFCSRHATEVLQKIGKSLPKGITYNINANHQFGQFFQEMEKPFFEESMIDHFVRTMSIAIALQREKTSLRDSRMPISHEENPALYDSVEKKFRKAFTRYRRKQLIHDFKLLPSLYGVRVLYFIRNYVVDGAFPFILVAFALAAIFQIIDLHWLRTVIPNPRPA